MPCTVVGVLSQDDDAHLGEGAGVEGAEDEPSWGIDRAFVLVSLADAVGEDAEVELVELRRKGGTPALVEADVHRVVGKRGGRSAERI